MADHAIGADHLDGMDGMFCGFGRIGGGRCGSGRGGFGLILVFGAGLGGSGRWLLAGEGGDQIAAGKIRTAVALPGRTAAQLGGCRALISGLGEVSLPASIDGIGIGQPGRVHLLDIGGIGAVEEGGRFENLIRSAVHPVCGGLFSHFKRL